MRRPQVLKNRKGFTLILMTGMMTILIGAAAFAVDFGSLYRYRSQLHNAADASALAAVVAFANGAGAYAPDSAVLYNSKNSVGTSTTTLARTDVHPGKWNGTTFTGTTPTADDWTSSSINAVQVTTRFTGSIIFGRVFGFASRNLTATAVAVHGSVGTLSCVRPWAVSYQSLLDQLGTGQTVTHDLTAAEVTQLANATSLNQIEMNQAGTDGAPHQARAVRMGPAEYATAPYAGSPNSPNANDYRDEIYTNCATLDALIGTRGVSVNDWLAPTPGQMTGPTEQGINQLLCGNQKGDPPCAASAKVNVAIWDTYGTSTHGNCTGCYHVKYVGIFYVTGYNHSGNSVRGYFSAIGDPTGGFSPATGPITKAALVQ